jgi:UPF0755 protein
MSAADAMTATLRMKMGNVFKKLVLWMAAAGFLAACAGLGFWFDMQRWADRPLDSAGQSQVFQVPSGQSVMGTAEQLQAAGIIASPRRFGWVARLRGVDTLLQAGEYQLSAAMSPNQIIDILRRGEVVLHKLTVPEGYTIVQIAAAAAEAGFANTADFEQAASDPTLLEKLGIPAASAEGYLFPETYFFPAGTGPRDIVRTMIERFQSVFGPPWVRRASQMGFSVHEIVTLASIIERETGAPSERALISSVFHNRLRRGMRLESDPTVIYGIEDFDGNLTRKHLETPTAYNTYRIGGLPPGPIANPGRASLEAALYPEKSPYIYFVSKKDRTHHFSTNLKEHNRAVRKYQLGRQP